MGSRLPYNSPEFEAAIEDQNKLDEWEKKQLKHFQAQATKPQALDAMLACAELAIRQENVALAEKYLDKVFAQKPLEADAHFLKATLLVAQRRPDDAIQYLKSNIKKLSQKTVDSARVYRAMAQYLVHFKNNLAFATRLLKDAIDRTGNYSFFHVTTRNPQDVTREQFNFDIELFDNLYSWEGYPAQVRFCAVSTDSQDNVYVLENNHKWLFKLNPKGELIEGFTEKQMSNVDFLFPENVWNFMDLAIDHQDNLYLASCQGDIHCFDKEIKLKMTFKHPERKPSRVLSIAVDSQGNLYSIYLRRKGIHVFDKEGKYRGNFGANTTMPDTSSNYYCGLAIDQNDHIYLYDRCFVQKFNLSTRELIDEAIEVPDSDMDDLGNEDYPFCWNGVAIDKSGYLYLANTYEENIVVLDKEENPHEMIDRMDQKLEVMSYPMDIALDNERNLYIVDTGNARIVKRTNAENSWSLILGHPNWKASTGLA